MDELNVTPQPEGDNPQGNEANPQGDQPTTPQPEDTSFSLDKSEETFPVGEESGTTPEPLSEGESSPEELDQPAPLESESTESAPIEPIPLPEQNNPAQMEEEALEPQIYDETEADHPTVLEQAEAQSDESGKKKFLSKPILIGLGVLALAAVAGAVVYFTNPTLFQGQVREIAETDNNQNLQPAADEYCQDGYYWPGSQSNDISMLESANAQTRTTTTTTVQPGFTVTDTSRTLQVGREPLEAEVNTDVPSLNVPSDSSGFSRDQCVPINLNDCRTMALLLSDTERFHISPGYAEILKATHDKNCTADSSISTTERDCGENASVDPTTGECTCNAGYIAIGEEEYQVPFAIAAVTYTRPICADCDELDRRVSTLEARQAAANDDATKTRLQTEIDALNKLRAELGCDEPERTCEDVQADLDQLNSSPLPPTADEIAALNAEAAALGCEEPPQDCRENEALDQNGDCTCDEEDGYFDIANNENPNARQTRECVDCEGLAERIDELEDMLANSDTLDMTDAQKATYENNLQNEIDRLKEIQTRRGCEPPREQDPTCDEILTQIATIESVPANQVTPEMSAELALLKQQAAEAGCEEPEEDPCEARIQEIEDLMDQGMFQEAYQKQLEYLESDCRGLEGCRAKLARAIVAKAFLELVTNDPVLTQYFTDEYEKHLDDYYLDPTCSDRSCDELEREASDGTRDPIEILTIDRETGDGNTTSISIIETPERELLTINTSDNVQSQGVRELNLLSQTNLETRVNTALEAGGRELLTDEEYYERYCRDPERPPGDTPPDDIPPGDTPPEDTPPEDTPADIPGTPEIPPAAPSDDPVNISQTEINPPTATTVTTTTTTTTEPPLHGGAPEEVQITESPEITKTGPEMYFFFFTLVASQMFYFRKKIYALIQNR